MKKALILDTGVVQVADETFEIASTLVWKDCPDETEAGWQYVDGAFSEVPVQPLDAMVALREHRTTLLDKSDWTQMPDAPSGGKTVWATYRQTLRDLPANTPDPANPTWPTPPE